MNSDFYDQADGKLITELACIKRVETTLCASEQAKLLDKDFFLVTLSDCGTKLFAKQPKMRTWFLLEYFQEKNRVKQGKWGKITKKEKFLLRVNALLENKRIIYLGKKPEGIS